MSCHVFLVSKVGASLWWDPGSGKKPCHLKNPQGSSNGRVGTCMTQGCFWVLKKAIFQGESGFLGHVNSHVEIHIPWFFQRWFLRIGIPLDENHHHGDHHLGSESRKSKTTLQIMGKTTNLNWWSPDFWTMSSTWMSQEVCKRFVSGLEPQYTPIYHKENGPLDDVYISWTWRYSSQLCSFSRG